MGQTVRIFVGAPAALAPFRQLDPAVVFYTLTPASDLAVLPFGDDLQDRLHDRYGTGDWPEKQSIRLSTTDQSFAADCSTRAPLAYIETDYFGGSGTQSAVLWQAGQLLIGPATLDTTQGVQRQPTLWPVNVVLRALGVRAKPPEDEFAAFGLANVRSNDDIHSRAWPLRT